MSSSSGTSKKHACQEPGCVKSFKRLDHLHRHALNHSAVGSTCPRCRAHFKRPDLLERHLLRHQKKDTEAGGEGLGVVETRKRLWCDVNGNVVKQRPKSPEKRKARKSGTLSPMDSPPSLCQSQLSAEPRVTTPSIEDDASERSCRGSEFAFHSRSHESPYFDLMPVATPVTSFIQTVEPRNSHEACFPGPGEIGHPDYVSHWIPNNSLTRNFSPGPSESPTIDSEVAFGKNANFGSIYNFEFTANPRRPSRSNYSFSDGQNYVQNIASMNIQDSHKSFSPPLRHFQQAYEPSMEMINAESQYVHYANHPRKPTASSEYLQHPPVCAEATSNHRPPVSNNLTTGQGQDMSNTKVCSMNDFRQPQQAPLLTQLLPFPSEMIKRYLYMYFEHFNQQWQLVHQASFQPTKAHPLLLASMVLTGASYGDVDAKELAASLQTSVKSQILRDFSTHAEPDLWLIQTLILVVSYDIHKAGQKEQIANHLFHSFLISLVQTSDLEATEFMNAPIIEENLHSQWRAAMVHEERKRATLICLVIDAQRAAIKLRSPDMCATELHVELPCDAEVWGSRSAEHWFSLTSKGESRQLYSTVLKSYMSREPFSRPPNLSVTSYVFVLYGLLSLSLSFKRQAQDVMDGNIYERRMWYSKLCSALDIWKADFDSDSPEVLTERHSGHSHSIASGAVTVYHIAHLVLNANISDLQMCNGLVQTGRRNSIEALQRECYQRVARWVTTKNDLRANRAAWHAAHIVRSFETDEAQYPARYDSYHPWCFYVAALTLQIISEVCKHQATPDVDSSRKASPTGSASDDTGSTIIGKREVRREVRNVSSTIISRGCSDFPDIAESFPMDGIRTFVVDFLTNHNSKFANELGTGLHKSIMDWPLT